MAQAKCSCFQPPTLKTSWSRDAISLRHLKAKRHSVEASRSSTAWLTRVNTSSTAMVKRPLSEHRQFAKCLNLEYPSEPEQTRLESPAITPGFRCIGWSPERRSAAPRCIPKGIVSVAKRPYGFTLKVAVGSRVSLAKKAPL